MNEPPPRLKHPSGWFAAGREVARGLALLSDGAFKVYIHLCLNSDRRTGQPSAEQGRLATALRKSGRSVVTYLDELRRQGVCSIQAAVNQHLGGQIEICDAFWPYEKVRPTSSKRGDCSAPGAAYEANSARPTSDWPCHCSSGTSRSRMSSTQYCWGARGSMWP